MNGHITDYIPKGRANAISRRDLACDTGLCDRVMRAYISRARAEGHPIIGDPCGGYYLADTEADKRLLLAELRSRIRKLDACYNAVAARRVGS